MTRSPFGTSPQRGSVGLIGLLALLPLAACDTTGVTNTQSNPYAVVSADLAAQGSAVTLAISTPSNLASLGPIEAIACQYEKYDPLPDDNFALALLRAEAAKHGATVLSDVSYRHLNVDIGKNCWTTIIADGTAWK